VSGAQVAVAEAPRAEPPRFDRCSGRYRHWFVQRGDRWRCERCGADVNAETFGWYMRGVMDGRGQAKRQSAAEAPAA
jgi:hypothetical protein